MHTFSRLFGVWILAAIVASGQTIGLFASALGSPFQAGTSSIALATADFNGDGKPDLAVANEYTNDFRGGGSITILLNDGSGGFVPATGGPIAVPFSPATIASGDFNNDGLVDLVLSSNGTTGTVGQLSIFLGDGSGGFSQAPGSPITVGNGPLSIAVADLNGDGNLDVAVALFHANQVVVLLGNGKASFSSTTFGTGLGPRAVVAGDFNGDGSEDLAVANFMSNDVTVLLGNGMGTFNPASGSPFAVSNSGKNPSPIAMASGDFNEDGHLDVAIVNSATNNVSIMLGNGAGGLSCSPESFVATAGFPAWISAGDVNGDRHLDLAIANADSNNVTVLLGTGTGSFEAANGSPFPVGAGPQSIVEEDFNGDGRPDLAVVDYTGQNVSELLNESCTMSVEPASLTMDASEGGTTLSVGVLNPSKCNWKAVANTSWITLGTGFGSDSGYETISLAQNTTGTQRTGTIQIAGTSVTVTQMGTTQLFADVLPSASYFDAVNLLEESGVTAGCGGGDFCPTQPTTRAQMAVFLIASVFGSSSGPVPPMPFFRDVPPGSFAFAQIQQLFSLGITSGCGGGNFCPNEEVTRSQAAIMIIRARYGSSAQFSHVQQPYFSDVPSNAFGFSFIQRMRQDGITSGCTETLFCPNNEVFRSEMAVFLERGLFDHGLQVGIPYIVSLSSSVLTAGSNVDINVTGRSTHFAQGLTIVNPISGLQVNRIAVTSPTQLTVNVTCGSTPTRQPESFWVTTGSEDAVLPAAISVR
jgi:hypothetical protein